MTETATKVIPRPGLHLTAISAKLRELRMFVGGIALLGLLPIAHSLWVAQLLLVPLVLVLPGVLLLRALRVPGVAVLRSPAYIPCASLVVLLVSGLATDLIGPVLDVAQPLHLGPVLIGLLISCIGLLASSLSAGPEMAIAIPRLSARPRLFLPAVPPILAVVGALELNTGHGAGPAIVAAIVALVAVVTVPLIATRASIGVLRAAVFAIGLSRAWSFSLRGQSVYGFDISTEYFDLHQTVAHGAWQVTHANDAYGAMLSTTVLPAELHELTGLSALMVFMALYPFILALFPVIIFDLATRFVEHRWATVAALLVIVQSYFAQQVTAVARQEVALVLFAAFLLTITDRQQLGRASWPLVALLGLGVVVSHYSTTYLTITVLFIALLAQLAVSTFRRRLRINGLLAVAFLTVVMGAALWYGAVTHSASNLSQFTATVRADGFSLLPNSTAGQSPVLAYLNGNSDQPGRAAGYQQYLQHQYAADRPYVRPLANADNGANDLVDDPAQGGSPLTGLLSDLSLVIQQLVNILAAVGAISLALWRRRRDTARLIGVLAIGTLIVLVVTRLSGTVATVYNQERAILQSWLLLGICTVWLLSRVAQSHRVRPSAVIAISASALGVLLLASSGLPSAMTSGPAPASLTGTGEDAERFVATAPELEAAQWLGNNTRPGQLLYADRYAQLRFVEVTGRVQGLLNDVTPQTLDQHAWVYANRTNVVNGRARASYNERSVAYQFPARFLASNYDLIYTNGSAEVYHR